MLTQLLTAPVGLPLGGLRFILEQLRDLAERELYDEGHLYEDLLLLQLRLDEGEIDEAAYQDAEAELMVRLRAARAYRAAQRTPPADGS
jgi:hypothetical protein